MILQDTDPRLEIAAVRERYSDPAAYSGTDDWHRFTANRIRGELRRYCADIVARPGSAILNAGAGNNDLGICPPTTLNLDISESGLSRLPNPIVGSVENIPLLDETIDTIICVGSVINYCSAAAAIREFQRILKYGGQLILEFESSRSAEFIGSSAFGRPAAIAETFYQGATEVVRVYDPLYIKNLLLASKLSVVRVVPIHIASPLALRATRNLRFAAKVARLDALFSHTPILSRWASNQILFCEKSI